MSSQEIDPNVMDADEITNDELGDNPSEFPVILYVSPEQLISSTEDYVTGMLTGGVHIREFSDNLH